MKSKASTKKKSSTLPSTTTASRKSARTRAKTSAPTKAATLAAGVSTTPPQSDVTPTEAGLTALSTNPIVAANAATLATAATSLQAAATAPGVPTGLDNPPSAPVPKVPVTFRAPPKGTLYGVFPNGFELGGMRQAVVDLNGFVGYAALMGSAVEPAATIASSVTRALAWREVKTDWDAYGGYVRVEDALAWQAALKLLDELKPNFLLAVAKNPELASMYPGLTMVFAAAKKIALKGAATKAKKAKAKAAASTVATPSAPETATAAPGAQGDAPKAGTTGS